MRGASTAGPAAKTFGAWPCAEAHLTEAVEPPKHRWRPQHAVASGRGSSAAAPAATSGANPVSLPADCETLSEEGSSIGPCPDSPQPGRPKNEPVRSSLLLLQVVDHGHALRADPGGLQTGTAVDVYQLAVTQCADRAFLQLQLGLDLLHWNSNVQIRYRDGKPCVPSYVIRRRHALGGTAHAPRSSSRATARSHPTRSLVALARDPDGA
jgi:hypothetical protein